jgi:hypothetical protein
MKVSQEEDHSGSKDNDVISLQIVESSQVDLDNKKQAKMLANATHLTPEYVQRSITNKSASILLSMLI